MPPQKAMALLKFDSIKLESIYLENLSHNMKLFQLGQWPKLLMLEMSAVFQVQYSIQFSRNINYEKFMQCNKFIVEILIVDEISKLRKILRPPSQSTNHPSSGLFSSSLENKKIKKIKKYSTHNSNLSLFLGESHLKKKKKKGTKLSKFDLLQQKHTK